MVKVSRYFTFTLASKIQEVSESGIIQPTVAIAPEFSLVGNEFIEFLQTTIATNHSDAIVSQDYSYLPDVTTII